METGLGEFVVAANMVVVQVGDDHVGNGCSVYINGCQCFGHGAHESSVASRGIEFSESSVDDPCLVWPDDGPHEVVHRHGRVVRVAADEVFTS